MSGAGKPDGERKTWQRCSPRQGDVLDTNRAQHLELPGQNGATANVERLLRYQN